MKLFCDNKVAINICHNPVHHGLTKHVEVDRHFIKEEIKDETICMTYVTTIEQVADLLTKSVMRLVFEKLIDKTGLTSVYSPT